MSDPVREPLDLPLPPALAALLAATPEFARARLVGGCVRDAVLGIPTHDLDVEVPGVDADTLARVLEPFGATDVIGKSFGVVKLTLASGERVDFTLPRRDSKVGPGHRGFEVVADPSLSDRDAALRRDFTLNALHWEPRTREVVDHVGGLADLRARVLRHTSAAFGEDPLRVLRGMQLAARFGLTAAPATLELARTITGTYAELAPDRVRVEWFKWAGRARVPSLGLRFLADAGWLVHYPELSALVGVEQDPRWHPEGDVWTHTLHALDALARSDAWRAGDEEARIVWTLAVLLHDTGKPATTRRMVKQGAERVVSYAHDTVGGETARSFLGRIAAPARIVQRVLPLVTQHMAHLQVRNERAVRRLAQRLEPETIAHLAVVIAADAAGRPPLAADPPESLVQLLALADALAVSDGAPQPLLHGRDLLARGWSAGPEIGRVLELAFEAQLDGAFEDRAGALAWLDARRDRPRS